MSERYSNYVSHVFVEHEPTPPPRAGVGFKVGCEIKLVDNTTREVITVVTPDHVYVNELVPREERKY